MNKNIKGDREVNTIRLFGLVLPSMPSLLFRLSGTFLRFKKDANKAGKIFRKELINQDVDKKTATELTSIYMKSSHIREYIQGFN